MAEIRSNPVAEVEVGTAFGFQPEFVETEANVTEEVEETPEATFEVEETEVEETPKETTEAPANAYTVPPVQEEQGEEEEETEGSFETEPEETDTDTRTNASILAESLKEAGGLPSDFEVSNNLTGYDLLDALEKSKETEAVNKVRAEYEQKYSEANLRYLDYLLDGGDPTLLSQTASLHTLPIEGEDEQAVANRKTVILAMFKEKGIKESRAARFYEDMLDSGEDLEAAKEAKEMFNASFQEEVRRVEHQKSLQQQQQEKQLNDLNESIKKTIRSKKLGDTELSDSQAKSLEKYMFEPTEIVDINQNGQPKKARVSKYYKEYSEFFADPQNLVRLARFIQSGGKQTVEEEEVERQVNRKLLDKLNNPERAGKSKQAKSVNNWLSMGR